MDSLFNVINVNIIPEYRRRVPVCLLYWRSCEAYERGIWQSIPHMSCEAVYEVVLAPVRFVSYDDYVPPIGKQWVWVVFLVRKEFLYRGEDYAARGYFQQVF